MKRRFLITGCGRSGTGFLAEVLTASGVPCGHEAVFTPTGLRPWNQNQGESSWFAAAMLGRTSERLPLIHVVRHPRAVAASWYRLGMFTPFAWRLVIKGRPRRLLDYTMRPTLFSRRISYVHAQRRLLRHAVPAVHEQPRELDRIYRYWVDWNLLVEHKARELSLPYLRVKLEAVDWSAIEDHIEERMSDDPAPSLAKARNQKLFFPPRPVPDHPLPPQVIDLARRYGYGQVE